MPILSASPAIVAASQRLSQFAGREPVPWSLVRASHTTRTVELDHAPACVTPPPPPICERSGFRSSFVICAAIDLAFVLVMSTKGKRQQAAAAAATAATSSTPFVAAAAAGGARASLKHSRSSTSVRSLGQSSDHGRPQLNRPSQRRKKSQRCPCPECDGKSVSVYLARLHRKGGQGGLNEPHPPKKHQQAASEAVAEDGHHDDDGSFMAGGEDDASYIDEEADYHMRGQSPAHSAQLLSPSCCLLMSSFLISRVHVVMTSQRPAHPRGRRHVTQRR